MNNESKKYDVILIVGSVNDLTALGLTLKRFYRPVNERVAFKTKDYGTEFEKFQTENQFSVAEKEQGAKFFFGHFKEMLFAHDAVSVLYNFDPDHVEEALGHVDKYFDRTCVLIVHDAGVPFFLPSGAVGSVESITREEGKSWDEVFELAEHIHDEQVA